MTPIPDTGGPIRPGNLIDCPSCGHTISASAAWVASVSQTLRFSKKHAARFALQNAPGVINEFPAHALDIFRCGKCGHRGAVRRQSANTEIVNSTHPDNRGIEVVITDPYNITTEEARAVVASGFFGMSIDQIIRLHNQIDGFDLNAAERAAVVAAFRKIDFGGSYDGMAVTSKPNRAN